MVDYTKWDAVELSDDSDIEVHPNVDKTSFIRAKQSQIHQERQQRKAQIESLKRDRLINEKLTERLSSLLSALQSKNFIAGEDDSGDSIGPIAFRLVMKLAPKNLDDDKPPMRKEAMAGSDGALPTYTTMIVKLLDEVKKSLDGRQVGNENRASLFLEEISQHIDKISSLQTEIEQELSRLEREGTTKITSESYRTGFDSSHVSKPKELTGPVASSSSGAAPEPKLPDLLNPGSAKASLSDPTIDINTEEVRASPMAKRFAQIQPSDYNASRAFISANTGILKESETDGLLVEAFDGAVSEKGDSYVWRHVHQAMLLQWCRTLGPSGMPIFFRGISTPGHEARGIFEREVQEKYDRIRELARESANKQSEGGGGGVEQIQIQSVEPGTSVEIQIPPVDSHDEDVQRARAVFEELDQEMRDALETGSLTEVNKVLGDMDVEAAERMVALLSEAGCLSIEPNVIDTTTKEGYEELRLMQSYGYSSSCR